MIYLYTSTHKAHLKLGTNQLFSRSIAAPPWFTPGHCFFKSHSWIGSPMSGITTPIIQGWSSKKSTPKSPEVYGKNDWLVVWTPLKNISQWEGLSHILWKIIQMFQSTKQMSSWRFHDRWFTSGKFPTLKSVAEHIFGPRPWSPPCNRDFYNHLRDNSPEMFPWFSSKDWYQGKSTGNHVFATIPYMVL